MKRRVPRVMVIVIVTVALLALFILTALPGTTRSRLGDFFGNIFDPLTTAFNKAIDGVGGFFTAVRDNRDLKIRIGELEEEKHNHPLNWVAEHRQSRSGDRSP
jgi:hypothetical protein